MTNMTKSDRIAELEAKVITLESNCERIDADRKTFVRHQETLCRNIRKLIAENRAYRDNVVSNANKHIRDMINDPIAATRRAFK